MAELPGVNMAKGSNAFYYHDHDINMVKVPLGPCEGDYILSRDELKQYFGLDSSRMGMLPECLIAPRLRSTWNSSRSGTRPWWDITGAVVAYKPLAWIPIVRERRTIPFSHGQVEYHPLKSTMITMHELYGSYEQPFTLSASPGWKALRMDPSTTNFVETSYKSSPMIDKETMSKGIVGKVVVKELTMGLCLRVRRLYQHSVHLYLNDGRQKDSLTWTGPGSWTELLVSQSLDDVRALQYHSIAMSGNGHSDSLSLQVLPVFGGADGQIKNMHLLVKCKTWDKWYLYNGGEKTPYGSRVETLPTPDNKKPLVTFMVVD